MLVIKLPDVMVRCEFCSHHTPESCFYKPEEVAWSTHSEVWVCSECWEEASHLEISDKAPIPWVFGADLITSKDEQRRRMIAAAAKQRMGVK